MKKIILVIILLTSLINCTNINNEDFRIIDGIKLGTTVDEFNKQCDSLKILHKVLYTRTRFSNLNQLRYNQINNALSEIFNTSQYKSQFTDHYGLYYPLKQSGTNNIVGLNVLLIHTEDADLISGTSYENITSKTMIKGANQDIPEEQTTTIYNMLVKKYGQPTKTTKSEFTEIYVIEEGVIKTYKPDSSNLGEMYYWETKNLDISYFKGVRSAITSFIVPDNKYMTYFKADPFRILDYEKGERYSRSFSYISYNLKDESIKKFGLDKSLL